MYWGHNSITETIYVWDLSQFMSSQSERTQTCICLPCAMILFFLSVQYLQNERCFSFLYRLTSDVFWARGKPGLQVKDGRWGMPAGSVKKRKGAKDGWEPLSAFHPLWFLPESQPDECCDHRCDNNASIQSLTRKVLCLLGAQWPALFLPCLQLQTMRPNQTKSHTHKYVCPTLYQGKFKSRSTHPGDTKFWSMNIHYNHYLNAEQKVPWEFWGIFCSIFSPKNLAYSRNYYKNTYWNNYLAFDSLTLIGKY